MSEIQLGFPCSVTDIDEFKNAAFPNKMGGCPVRDDGDAVVGGDS